MLFRMKYSPMAHCLLNKVAEFAEQSRRVCRTKSPSLPNKVAEFAEQSHYVKGGKREI